MPTMGITTVVYIITLYGHMKIIYIYVCVHEIIQNYKKDTIEDSQ